MARETSGRIKKYGVCLNSGCTQYKQIQEIVHGDMECPECHKKLSPCAPPKKKSNKKLPMIIAGAILVIAIIVGCIVAFSGSKSEPQMPTAIADTLAVETTPAAKAETVTVAKTDVEEQVDTVTQNSVVKEEVAKDVKSQTPATEASVAATSGNGSLQLSYGNYSGAIKNGYPHGQGRLTYTKSRLINRNDAKGRTADAGDYIIGEFYNGFVVYGKHYDAAGNLIGSLNFGVGSESSYDSK